MPRTKIALILFILILAVPQRVTAGGPGDLVQIGMAFLANLVVHESGHFIIAEGADALDNKLDFFSRDKGSFFMGLSTVSTIDRRHKASYILGGEIATSLLFELALARYRSVPTAFNRGLLFFSGTEFLWYSVYAFYLAPARDIRYDPVAFVEETDIRPEAIVVVAATQTLLNAYRVIDGQDRWVPYFSFDRDSVSFQVAVRF